MVPGSEQMSFAAPLRVEPWFAAPTLEMARLLLRRAVQRNAASSFDHLIGAGKQTGGYRDAERLGGLKIDYKLDSFNLLDRQIGGLVALEDPTRVDP